MRETSDVILEAGRVVLVTAAGVLTAGRVRAACKPPDRGRDKVRGSSHGYHPGSGCVQRKGRQAMSNNETEDPIKAYARECFDRILNEQDPDKRKEIRKEILRGKTIDIEEYIAELKAKGAEGQGGVEKT